MHERLSMGGAEPRWHIERFGGSRSNGQRTAKAFKPDCKLSVVIYYRFNARTVRESVSLPAPHHTMVKTLESSICGQKYTKYEYGT